jgi:hypothetical protein
MNTMAIEHMNRVLTCYRPAIEEVNEETLSLTAILFSLQHRWIWKKPLLSFQRETHQFRGRLSTVWYNLSCPNALVFTSAFYSFDSWIAMGS